MRARCRWTYPEDCERFKRCSSSRCCHFPIDSSSSSSAGGGGGGAAAAAVVVVVVVVVVRGGGVDFIKGFAPINRRQLLDQQDAVTCEYANWSAIYQR